MSTGVGELFPVKPVDIIALGGATSIAIASTATAFSQSFPLERNCTYSWFIQFASPGTIAVTVELEQGFKRPTTEKAVDAVNFCIPDNKLTTNRLYASVTDALLHNVAYAPNATPVGRLKFTGTGANDAATTCTLALMCVGINR